MKVKNIFVLFSLIISINVFAANKENALAVHLLSYLAQDYGEAVNNGKVISKEEYQEQVDFIMEVVRIAKDNRYDDELNEEILSLKNSIMAKEKEAIVSENATKIKSNILKKFSLLTYPEKRLNLVKAEKLFKNNCMSCHGSNGYGDGKDGVGLEPAPTNFHDLERMHNVSPYGAFNTISLGVNGTGMAPFDNLSEEDRWSLAYYVTSFRFKGISKIDSLNLDVKDSSSLSDNEIKKMYNIDDEKLLGVLASVRDVSSGPPDSGNKGQLDLHLTKAIKDLKSSFILYKSGKFSEAKNLSLMAYLKGIEPVEGILKSTDAQLVLKLESDLSKYRYLIDQKVTSKELVAVLNPIVAQLENLKANGQIKKTNSSSFFMAFGIVLREAFEAGLILFLLFGMTRKSKATEFNKNIHAGWLSSLLIGIVLFSILESFFTVSGKMAESIEGYSAIIASLMLFYVGYWLHKNTDILKIKDKLTGAVQNSVSSGKGMALFFIAFTACFREIFETILFLKIIIIDGHKIFYVGVGTALAIILTMVVITFAVKYSIKLNLKYLFKASTILILALSTIFLGKGIGALQKTGILEQTRIDSFSAPSIGFNSTMEVMMAQLAALFIIFIFALMSYREKRMMKASN